MKSLKTSLVTLIAVSVVLAVSITAFSAGKWVQALQDDALKIKFNGEVETFIDSEDGSKIVPLLYNGRTYLPVRAISNLAGLDVDYDESSHSVLLTDKSQNNTYIEENEEQEMLKNQTVSIEVLGSDSNKKLGTGFYIKDDLIMTNYHVIAGAKQLNIQTNFDNDVVALDSLVYFDIKNDVAVLKTTKENRNIKQLERVDIKAGEEVTGLIYSKDRAQLNSVDGTVIAVRHLQNPSISYIDCSFASFPGNSGSLVYNEQGKILGMLFAGAEGENATVVISINSLIDILDDVLKGDYDDIPLNSIDWSKSASDISESDEELAGLMKNKDVDKEVYAVICNYLKAVVSSINGEEILSDINSMVSDKKIVDYLKQSVNEFVRSKIKIIDFSIDKIAAHKVNENLVLMECEYSSYRQSGFRGPFDTDLAYFAVVNNHGKWEISDIIFSGYNMPNYNQKRYYDDVRLDFIKSYVPGLKVQSDELINKAIDKIVKDRSLQGNYIHYGSKEPALEQYDELFSQYPDSALILQYYGFDADGSIMLVLRDLKPGSGNMKKRIYFRINPDTLEY